MSTELQNREAQRVRELAVEYSRKGYDVNLPTDQSTLPQFLKEANYLPDLIVKSAAECLVIEVKTSESLRRDKRLSEVSDLVNRQPGWQFLFVLTNPKTPTVAPVTATSERWQDLLAKSRHPALRQHPELSDAAFLFAWSAFEALLRSDEQKDDSPRAAKTSLSLVRDAVIKGLLDRKDMVRLEALFRVRNSILHAGGAACTSAEDVADVQRYAEEIARNLDAGET